MPWHGEALECLPKHFLAFATNYRGREVFHAQLATSCVKEVGEKNKIKVLKGSECRAKDLEPYHLFFSSTSCSGPRCHHLPATLHRSPTHKAVTHRSPYSIPALKTSMKPTGATGCQDAAVFKATTRKCGP